MRQGVFLPEAACRTDYNGVQPPCAIAPSNSYAHVKNPLVTTLAAKPLVWTQAKAAQLGGMGCAAFAVAVGKETQILPNKGLMKY